MPKNRQHVRVLVQFRTSFSTKKQKQLMIAGDGELRNLSPGGCCVSSSVPVAVGTELGAVSSRSKARETPWSLMARRYDGAVPRNSASNSPTCASLSNGKWRNCYENVRPSRPAVLVCLKR